MRGYLSFAKTWWNIMGDEKACVSQVSMTSDEGDLVPFSPSYPTL